VRLYGECQNRFRRLLQDLNRHQPEWSMNIRIATGNVYGKQDITTGLSEMKTNYSMREITSNAIQCLGIKMKKTLIVKSKYHRDTLPCIEANDIGKYLKRAV
jgi:hypothetical protein